ncbi:hypothetical protein HYDPIDRAFT_91813 [Hydnomerulius pinastri MD-312]|uniref:2OGFeDO JBP1/TET oxygenase domain-containing protein n=1 Tax=Hydnomerulius pinastri MD-312 TaxID=994086 RepID=A0A0C9VZK8_9AGAM|nr:hypothetical protein HYDPIDRAFT_91813 [Hydnomerulius pinastri MD-312]
MLPTCIVHKQRKFQVEWDAEEYFHHLGKRNFGLQEDFEASMLQRFPPIKLSQYLLPTNAARSSVITNPFIITDIKDHIILWFLPGIFTPSRQDAIMKAMNGLKLALSKPKQVTGWGTDTKYYKSDADGGVLNVSPTWHAQAHEASLTPDDLVWVTPLLWCWEGPVQQWLCESETSFRLVDALLTIVHPELYRRSSAVREQLLADEEIMDLHELIRAWPTLFTAISVVYNRETPFHRDSKLVPQWYDLFLSVGSYTDAVLELPTLGIHAHYMPGTAALFSGLLLRHGVSPVDQGDRIGYVFYMRPSMFHFASISLGKWVKYSSLSTLYNSHNNFTKNNVMHPPHFLE